MKIRILIFILFFLSVYASRAQTKEHMEFKGIPITGHMDDFVKKLEDAGFKVEVRNSTTTALIGSFANKECDIYVYATPRTKTVYNVIVSLPSAISWNSIRNSYTSFKEQFTTKYGEPSKELSSFAPPYEEGDGNEMVAIKSGKCTYLSLWRFYEGTILVFINSNNQGVGFCYEDSVGELILNAEENAIVNSDI